MSIKDGSGSNVQALCRIPLFSLALPMLFVLIPFAAFGQPTMSPSEQIPSLFEQHAASLSLVRPALPRDPEGLRAHQEILRDRHAAALGVPPVHEPTPITYNTVATVDRNGYTLKKILFESQPNLYVTAHLYLPATGPDPHPAVLCVHGHWPGAKNAVQVHARCVFLAMRGFVVLALDAIGAGERAYQGITYHGRLLGYQPLPAGLSLAGLQVEENRRALDLLCTLPEVDPNALGVTGASGGGNQSFHLAILDARIKAAVPVCFFGSYCGYLRGAHCACETIPHVLTYAEEGDLAALIAPRSLMIIAAKEDAGAAFRIADARHQASVAQEAYETMGVADQFEFVEFEGGHDYSQVMRERMVAFFEGRLLGKESGLTVPEPQLDLMDEKSLAVLESATFPEGALFVPQIVERESARLVDEFSKSKSWADPGTREALRNQLINNVLGGFPADSPLDASPSTEIGKTFLSPEPGVWVNLDCVKSVDNPTRVVLVVGPMPDGASIDLPEGTAVMHLSPRGTGATRWPAANTVDCQDYLLAQGSVVLGRPMIGQWVWDILRTVQLLQKDVPDARFSLYGQGEFGLAAVLAGVIEEDIDAVAASDILSSYVWPDRFDDRWGLVHFVPNILQLGDIPQIAQGIYPRALSIVSPRTGGGSPLSATESESFKAGLTNGLETGSWNRLQVTGELTKAQAFDQLIRESSAR